MRFFFCFTRRQTDGTYFRAINEQAILIKVNID